jgi:hypothetical protein
VLARDFRLNDLAASPHLVALRTIGERKLAYELTMVDVPNSQTVSNVRISENGTNGTDANVLEPSELRFFSSGPSEGNNTNNNRNWAFNYNLRDARTPAATLGDDTLQTMEALKTRFNLEARSNQGQGQGGDQLWTLTIPTTLPTPNVNMTDAEDDYVAARRFLPLGIEPGTGDDWQVSRNSSTANRIKKLFLTVSAGMFWGPTLNTVGTPLHTFGSPFSSAATADLETNRERFYFYTAGNNITQERLRWLTRLAGTPAVGSNIVSIKRDLDSGPLPPLRVTALKLESDDFSPPPANTPRSYNPVRIEIEATIFAQEGSWFAIPLPVQHRNDIDSSGGNSSPFETARATRMRRLNYDIRVKGSIVQNFAPSALVDYDSEESPDGSTVGAMSQWVSSLAYPTNIERDEDTIANGRGRDWHSIRYEAAAPVPVNTGLKLPLSPDIELVN